MRKCWWHLQCTAQSMIHHDAADIGSTLRSQLWRHRSPTKSRHKLRPCMHACMCCHRLLLRSLGSNVNGERARAGGKKTAVCFSYESKKWAPKHLYCAAIAGSVGHPGAYNKWCVMVRHDRARSLRDQACARLRPATLRCINFAIAT